MHCFRYQQEVLIVLFLGINLDVQREKRWKLRIFGYLIKNTFDFFVTGMSIKPHAENL